MTSAQIKTLIKNGNIEVIATLLVAIAFGWQAIEANEPEVQDELSLDVRDMLVRTKLVSNTRAALLLDHFGPACLLRLLTEQDEDTLQECEGIGEKIAHKVCTALAPLARDLAERHQVELSQLGETPCRVVLGPDFEQEYEVTRTVLDMDKHGFPVRTTETFTTDSSDINAWYTRCGDNPVLTDRAQKNDACCRNVHETLPPDKQFYSASSAWPRQRWAAQHSMYIKWMCAIRKHAGNEANLRKLWNSFWAIYRRKSPEQRAQWLWKKQITNIRAAFDAVGIRSKKHS